MKTINTLILTLCLQDALGFQTTGTIKHEVMNTSMIRTRKHLFVLHAKRNERDIEHESNKTSSSRFGVRKRVRSVLEKAKTRTGIRNTSEYLNKYDTNDSELYPVSSSPNISIQMEEESRSKIIPSNISSTSSVSNVNKSRSVSSIVADAASIGGLGSGEFDLPLGMVKSNDKVMKSNDRTFNYSSDSLLLDDATEKDVISSDTAGAMDLPLPFKLPVLTPEQQKLLNAGERVQFQSDMGREGYGFVVVDVHAPAAVVWECLLDFYSYPQIISTVRDVEMFTSTRLQDDYKSEDILDQYEDGTYATLKHGVPSVTRAAFTLSKFRLKIAAIHKYRPHPAGDYMVFTLDPACTNMVLQYAKGTWHTQSDPDGKGEDYTRVWLLCELRVSPLLPQWITDYAARRAMPRATTWIKPHVEAASELWFKDVKA